jgi:hypothetical protein
MRLTAPGGARRLGHGAKVDEGHVEQPGRYRDGQGPPFRPEPDLTHDEQGQGEHPDYRKGGAVHPSSLVGIQANLAAKRIVPAPILGHSRGTALITQRAARGTRMSSKGLHAALSPGLCEILQERTSEKAQNANFALTELYEVRQERFKYHSLGGCILRRWLLT